MVGRQTPILALFVPLILVGMVDGMRGVRAVWPAAMVAGVTFAVGQFVSSNYISVELTDIIGSLLAVAAMVAFLRVWSPGDPLVVEDNGGGRPAIAGAAEHDAGHEERVRRREGTGGRDSAGEVFAAYAPYLIVIVVFSLAQLGPIKDFLAEGAVKFTWPGVGDIRNAAGEPPSAVEYNFNWLPAAGTLLLICGLITMAVLKVSPGRALRAYGATLNQLKWATLTVAAVLALAYVMNLSAQTLTIGTWIAGAGGLLAFLSPIIGWLGVAVTGSDTSSNSLFGVLQVTAAKEAGLDPTLLGRGELLGRRPGQDDLAAEPRDRRRGGRPRRRGGRALPSRLRMEHPAVVGHVRAGLSAIHGGVVMDGRVKAAPEGPAKVEEAPSQAPRDISELVAELRRIAGSEWVYTADHQLRTYESDGLLQYTSTPAAAVLPNTAEQVRDIVRACAREEVAWVARGAGSGLSGGALPVKDGVLLVLSRMKRILEIDLDNGRVCVEPGVTNANVSAAVGPEFFYPPDPSSQIVCSIGGNVAENSGGAHCFKYGFTTNYVTGLEIVLGDGEMVQVGGYELDSPGYDLLGAFVGVRGHAGRGDQDLAAGGALARDGAHARGLLRLHPRGRRGGLGDRAERRRARRDRDDGRARHRGLRADGQRGLEHACRRPAGGARRVRAGVRGALRRRRGRLRALRLR